MKQTYLLIFILFSCFVTQAQTEILSDTILKRYSVTPGRMQLHLMIQREQKKADASDGVHDKLIGIDEDMDKTAILSNAIFTKVNKTIAYVENNETDDMLKRKFLGRVIDNLKLFNLDFNDGYVDIVYYQNLFEYTYQIIRGLHNKNLAPYVKANVNKAMYLLSPLFESDKQATFELMSAMSDLYPEILIKKIKTITNPEATDVVVAKAAPKNPKLILNYATSTAEERNIVRRNKDPYVQSIIRIADSATTPLKAIFFVEELIKEKTTIKDLNKITENQDEYFKKMIEMRQVYFTSDLRKMYDRELVHEASRYVSSMNELHASGESIRFKCLDKLSATEVYYVMVYGSDDLYTSSFLGCYNRLLTRMKPKSGNEFLESIGKDKFRTFLRLCANYNTISSFLSTMKDENQKLLMRDFVSGLDNTLENDLEGATDVANSFGSIHDSSLMANIIEEIKNNRTQDSIANNVRGFRIYDILYTMLTYSNDSITAKLGIPPITVMPYSQLINDSGIVVQQVFFFGDTDGKGVFNSFVGGFGAPNWKVKREENWVFISSLKGKPVHIYCNVPFDEPGDEKAQNALQDYLDENEIHPSVIIHRGHSYHLSSTLDHINSRHKVVILGACGAYQNLSTVLSHSEDAQIVSTKQIGSGKINGPIIRAFNERLLAGKDIDWVEMWTQLGKQFSGGESKQLFDDYVPPFKNLGALFLKAYRKSTTEEF
ncbi:MAG: hypothetical protein KA198_05030 [Chitinophagaceae bacterium]|nr:hypothetical protein [Chitinophagaceae bacterium]